MGLELGGIVSIREKKNCAGLVSQLRIGQYSGVLASVARGPSYAGLPLTDARLRGLILRGASSVATTGSPDRLLLYDARVADDERCARRPPTREAVPRASPRRRGESLDFRVAAAPRTRAEFD